MNFGLFRAALTAVAALLIALPASSQEPVRKVRAFIPISVVKSQPASPTPKVPVNQFGYRGEQPGEATPTIPVFPPREVVEPPVPVTEEDEHLGIPPLAPEEIGKLGTEVIPAPPLEEAIRMSTRYSEVAKENSQPAQNSGPSAAASTKSAPPSAASSSGSRRAGQSSASSSRWGKSSGSCAGGT